MMPTLTHHRAGWLASQRLAVSAKRTIANVVSLTLLTQMPTPNLYAAELMIGDGVVIKFGTDAQLVVRDHLVPGQGITLTGQKDDTVAGQTGTASQSAAAGDWRGVRIEKSAAAYGGLALNDVTLRYAGALDADATAALTVRGWNPSLQLLQITDSALGLRLLDGASPAIGGASFLRNATGIEANGNSAPAITGSQFDGNTVFAINNKTPATAILATGNWWGNSSGPREAGANPQGLGDPVSTGVDFGSYLAAAPLLNPALRLAIPATYFEQHMVLLDLSCINATEYRLAEGSAFAGVAFQPLLNGRGQVLFATSDGDGNKNVNVQYRNAANVVVSASLNGGVLIDTQPPAVAVTSPTAGSQVTQTVTVQANASDASGIAQVQFYIDNVLAVTRSGNAPPATAYTYAWDTDTGTEGSHTIKVIATDQAGRVSEKSENVIVLHHIAPTDTTGPQLTTISANGAPLADGATLTRSTSITLTATDASGVARVDILLDGAVAATASGGSNGSYSAPLNLDNVANGPHTLAVRAADSVGNLTTGSYAISVAHAAPNAPSISQPVSGLTTRLSTLAVSGSAKSGGSVQLVLNGQPSGTPVTAGSDGRFTLNATLANGANQLAATVTDQYGVSAASSAILVTLDVTVPASPANLTAAAQPAGKVHLAWARSTDPNATGYDVYRAPNPFAALADAVKVNASPLSATTFDDLPPQDTAWTYRVAAVNNAGTSSVPGNAVQVTSDSIAPKALSIAYTPLGRSDPATGRIGQGQVNVLVTLSEALPGAPYLSIVPQGGAPITVNLTNTGNGASVTYSGSFLIDASTASGVANALFSARDAVGNRGTDITTGATIRIDAEGPVLSAIVLNPAAPIKNDPAQTIQASFTFSKAPASAPQVNYLLSGATAVPVPLGGLIQVNSTTYSASFTLPSGAGAGSPGLLSFSAQAKDDLDNVSTKVAALNRFQVYQGNLPPLAVPFGFSAIAQPGGKAKLGWQAVDQAGSYQIYRQGPADSALQPLTRTSGIAYIDQTTQDGAYKYAVASVRQSNGQEALSSQTAPIDVVTSANAPGAPQNLSLQLTGQGIYATWQPPLSSTVDYYNLYRTSGTRITSIDGLTPIKTRIKSTVTYDTNPSPVQGAYVVTALDTAGNESALSNSSYLNASLLPVRNLKVEQRGNDLPTISWDAPNGNVSGYLVYIGPDAAKIKLTPSPITATTLTDTGYTSGERRYTVAAVDANGVEMPRSVVLPSVGTQISAGLPIKRGIMNRLQVQVVNPSATALYGVQVVVRLPINQDGTQFKDHKSEVFSLAANQTSLIPVIVGGYAELPGAPQAQVGVEIAPNDGELVRLAHNQSVDVIDGALVVGMATDEFTRGASGKLKLTIENTSEVDIELQTATSNGAADSSELRFKILDGDGNVLATMPYKQVFGASVVTLTNGQTVARIPAGASYVSDVFSLNVPAASPNSIRVRLDVDKLRYHTGLPDEVQIVGRGSEKAISLLDTAYFGEVTAAAPLSSFGDQDIQISGRALDRIGKMPLPNTRLKLILNQQGFERSFSVLTDAAGSFVYTFKPGITDTGLYKVSAVHPDITDRPEQKAFTINRVTVGPTPYKLDIPKNFPFTIPFTAKAGPGTAAANLRFVLDAASQPTGQLPAGISTQLPAPLSITERQTLNLPVIFTGGSDAQPSGSLILNVISDEHPGTPIGQVKVNYTLSDAKPFLVSTPNYVETGLAQGSSQIESVTIKNSGLQDAANLQFSLTKADGSPAPGWVAIASQANGALAVGATRSIDLSFTPPTGTQEGVYELKLNINGDSIPAQAVNVFASITQSGQGNVLFKAADIYTATVDKNGHLIPGLSNAAITLQNEDVATVTQNLTTDALGEALFQNLPAGSYKFRAKANNHQEVGGRLLVKPGITANQPIFLDYNLVTVEWSVREVAIQDRYEVTLNATFETDVPAAVVVMQPASINLPKMNAGDVYYGELNLTNFGLVRADQVIQSLPKSDGFFRYEFLVDVPPALDAKQRITIPYRVVALESLEGAASGGNASGGGCFNYSNSTGVGFKYRCANGSTSSGSSSSSFFSVSSSSCGSGSGSGGAGGGNGGGNSGFSVPSSNPTTPIKLKGKKCVFIPSGAGAGGGGGDNGKGCK